MPCTWSSISFVNYLHDYFSIRKANFTELPPIPPLSLPVKLLPPSSWCLNVVDLVAVANAQSSHVDCGWNGCLDWIGKLRTASATEMRAFLKGWQVVSSMQYRPADPPSGQEKNTTYSLQWSKNVRPCLRRGHAYSSCPSTYCLRDEGHLIHEDMVNFSFDANKLNHFVLFQGKAALNACIPGTP